MIKAINKALLLVAAGLLIGGLSGCGNKSNSSGTVPATEQTFYAHSVVFGNHSTLWSSGYNAYGNLGTGTLTVTTAVFQPVALQNKYEGYAAGANHTLAFNDSTIYAWGCNFQGRLGVSSIDVGGSKAYSFVPRPVESIVDGKLQPRMPDKVYSVAAGWLHSVAVAGPNRSVLAWGGNTVGQLGLGTEDQSAHVIPTPVLGPGGAGTVLDNVIQVAAGGSHSLALRGDGSVYGWGDNAWGQVGAGAYNPQSHVFAPIYQPLPVQVTFPNLPAGVSVIKVAAAGSYSLALMSDHTVWAWGYNAYGQLGNNSLDLVANPTPAKVQVPVLDANGNLQRDPKTNAIITEDFLAGDISAGLMHVLALRFNSNEIWSWGFNEKGQLGTGEKSLPIPYAIKANNFSKVPDYATFGASSIYAFGNTSFARIHGKLYGWGDNGSGQLGYPVSDTALAYYLPAVPILYVP